VSYCVCMCVRVCAHIVGIPLVQITFDGNVLSYAIRICLQLISKSCIVDLGSC